MAHTYTNLLYHTVWSTKNREPFIDEEIKADLFAYLGGIVRDLNGTALLVNGVEDHVHTLMLLPQTIALADAVRDIKANSSGWVHEKWPEREDFAWQTGYAAFTVSQSQRNRVLQYIAKQEEHHKKRTFKEEYLDLLKRHGIDYDPRFVFD